MPPFDAGQAVLRRPKPVTYLSRGDEDSNSSAGGLTVAAMLKLRDDGAALPAGGVPISPWVDLACTGETLETNATADLTATRSSLQRMAGQHLQGADPYTPLASPLYADLSGLPPLLVVVGGAEALLDHSVRLARSAGMAGVGVTLYIGAGMQHIFPIYCGVIPESNAAAAMIGAWVRSRTSRENAEAAHDSKDDALPASGQDSEEASPLHRPVGKPSKMAFLSGVYRNASASPSWPVFSKARRRSRRPSSLSSWVRAFSSTVFTDSSIASGSKVMSGKAMTTSLIWR